MNTSHSDNKLNMATTCHCHCNGASRWGHWSGATTGGTTPGVGLPLEGLPLGYGYHWRDYPWGGATTGGTTTGGTTPGAGLPLEGLPLGYGYHWRDYPWGGATTGGTTTGGTTPGVGLPLEGLPLEGLPLGRGYHWRDYPWGGTTTGGTTPGVGLPLEGLPLGRGLPLGLELPLVSPRRPCSPLAAEPLALLCCVVTRRTRMGSILRGGEGGMASGSVILLNLGSLQPDATTKAPGRKVKAHNIQYKQKIISKHLGP